ncbi:MAG: sulfatase-like hydrolase/transferase [Planctomycetaceae bacterium]
MRLFCLCLLGLLSPLAAADRPNIILMMADDQGWNGTSVAMHPDIPGSRGEIWHTPNLERLAAQGMRFSAGYSPAPVCSPTRISIQTGKSPAQLHWTKAAPPEQGHKLTEPRLIKQISSSEKTLGELLQSVGYATAHYGKWHISGGGPEQHGYDQSDGDTGNENAFQYQDPNPVDIFGMADKAEKFMAQAQKARKPFYIQLSWNALHASENALRTTMAKYERQLGASAGKRAAVAAITEDLDTGVGKVLDSIERLGLTDSTWVFYISDNGAGGGGGGAGGGRTTSLRGGKGGVWEGGIRVPWIVRGPGLPANSWCHTRVVGYDLLPTFCELAGVPADAIPPKVEGGSFAALLRNQGQGEIKRPRPELVFHFPHYQASDGPQSALLLKDLKLIRFLEDNHVELYDLAKDPGEQRDLAQTRPDDAQRLDRMLGQYLTDIDAQMPEPNPDYDPSAPPPQRKGGRNATGGKPGQGGKGGMKQGGGKGAAAGGKGGGRKTPATE